MASKGIAIESLAIHNLAERVQAEALALDKCDYCVVRNVHLISRIDTLRLTGRVHVVDSRIDGMLDFIWGKGVGYFEKCEVRSTIGHGKIVCPVKQKSRYGFIFVNCRFTNDFLNKDESSGSGKTSLARIRLSKYPCFVAFIGCEMWGHISPLGWEVQNKKSGGTCKMLEYRSTVRGGGRVD